MRKTLELPVAVLGVLKPGGCYVPLDATYGRERLAGMLESAGVEALLTHEPAAEALPPNGCSRAAGRCGLAGDRRGERGGSGFR